MRGGIISKLILLIGTVTAMLAGLYPPWTLVLLGTRSEQPCGYGWLFHPSLVRQVPGFSEEEKRSFGLSDAATQYWNELIQEPAWSGLPPQRKQEIRVKFWQKKVLNDPDIITTFRKNPSSASNALKRFFAAPLDRPYHDEPVQDALNAGRASLRIDTTRLAIEWIVIALATLGALVVRHWNPGAGSLKRAQGHPEP